MNVNIRTYITHTSKIFTNKSEEIKEEERIDINLDKKGI